MLSTGWTSAQLVLLLLLPGDSSVVASTAGTTTVASSGSSTTGSAPAGSTPAGSSPAGSAPAGSAPTGSAPTGSASTGSTPAGSLTAGKSPTRGPMIGNIITPRPATGSGPAGISEPCACVRTPCPQPVRRVFKVITVTSSQATVLKSSNFGVAVDSKFAERWFLKTDEKSKVSVTVHSGFAICDNYSVVAIMDEVVGSKQNLKLLCREIPGHGETIVDDHVYIEYMTCFASKGGMRFSYKKVKGSTESTFASYHKPPPDHDHSHERNSHWSTYMISAALAVFFTVLAGDQWCRSHKKVKDARNRTRRVSKRLSTASGKTTQAADPRDRQQGDLELGVDDSLLFSSSNLKSDRNLVSSVSLAVLGSEVSRASIHARPTSPSIVGLPVPSGTIFDVQTPARGSVAVPGSGAVADLDKVERKTLPALFKEAKKSISVPLPKPSPVPPPKPGGKPLLAPSSAKKGKK